MHVPVAKKSGLGAMLPDGFEIVSGADLVTVGLFNVVVVVGATVVGVTTVVGGGVVVVGLEEPVEFERDWALAVLATACEWRVLAFGAV